MDIEQLKLVLEAIGNVGGEAKEFGIWWLICRTIPSVLTFVFGVVFVVLASRRIREGVASWSAAFAIGREVGHVPYVWDEQDTGIVVSKIRQLKQEKGDA